MYFNETMVKRFEHDLDLLITELNLYNNENELWHKLNGTNNSGGNICLHLIGNLNHFFGAVLTGNGYVRNRAAEFNNTSVSRLNLITEIQKVKTTVTSGIIRLESSQLEEMFPLRFGGKTLSNAEAIVQLSAHLNYHLGQLNYHRRYFSQDNQQKEA